MSYAKTNLQYDIREAPSAIRDSYKMYYKLKTSFLEETLSDALDEDSFDLSILENSNSQTDSRFSSSFSELSTPDVSALTSESSIILQNSSIDALHSTNDTTPSNSFPVDYHSQSDRTEFVAEEVHVLNDKAWVRTTKTVSNTSLKANNSSSSRKSMSDKLFRGASFQKRNPRKSLSRSSLTSNHSSQSLLSSSQKELFPDLQTFLSQKSKKQEENNDEKTESQPAPIPLELKPASTNLINKIDEEWLNRCNKANNMENDLIATSAGSSEIRDKTTTMTTTEHPKVFGLSNINVSALASFERSQNTQEVAPKSMLSFDMNNLNLTAQNSFGGITAQGSLGFSSLILDEVAGDDEEIANSEDEADMNLSRPIRSIRNSTKRKHNEIDDEKPTKLVKIPTKVDSNPNINNNTKEEKPVNVAKTKSQAIRKTKSITKPKPKPNVKPESNVVNHGAIETVVVTRKSSRNATKTTSYTQIISKSDNEEDSDPFAGDDSDKDPNFSDSQETKSKNRMPNIVSSPNTSDDETPQQQKEETVKKTNTRKRIARTKAAPKQPRVKVERKARLPAKKKPTMANGNSSASEIEPTQETPDDYMLEFGMEKFKSVPRVPIAELKQNTLEFSKYVYSTESSGKIGEGTNAADGASKSNPLSTKNSIARDKLESKIAAGALNENYVRLNLRKKVFVRGHKTINFSRYKKKLWKSKKAAALSGPEMDMRGCDGGVLTCFQCGLPGHFAEKCTAKSE